MASEHAVTWTRQDAEIQYKGKDLGQVIAERDARIEALELALQDAGKVKPEWIEDLFAQVTVSKKMQSELTLTKKNMKALATELKSVKAELREAQGRQGGDASLARVDSEAAKSATVAGFTDIEDRLALMEKWVAQEQVRQQEQTAEAATDEPTDSGASSSSAPDASVVGVRNQHVIGAASAGTSASSSDTSATGGGSSANIEADADDPELISEHTGWHYSMDAIQKTIKNVVGVALTELSSNVGRAEAAGRAAMSEMEALRQRLDSEKGEQKVLDELQLAECKQEDDMLRSDIANVRRELRAYVDLKAWNKAMTASNARIDSLRAEFGERQEEMSMSLEKKFQEEVMQLYTENEAQHARRTNAVNALKQLVDATVAKMEKFLREYNDINEANLEVGRKAHAEVEQCKERVAKLERDMKPLEKRVTALEEAQASLTSRMDDTDHSGPIADLRTDLEALVAGTQEMKDSLDERTRQHTARLDDIDLPGGRLAKHDTHWQEAQREFELLDKTMKRCDNTEIWQAKLDKWSSGAESRLSDVMEKRMPAVEQQMSDVSRASRAAGEALTNAISAQAEAQAVLQKDTADFVAKQESNFDVLRKDTQEFKDHITAETKRIKVQLDDDVQPRLGGAIKAIEHEQKVLKAFRMSTDQSIEAAKKEAAVKVEKSSRQQREYVDDKAQYLESEISKSHHEFIAAHAHLEKALAHSLPFNRLNAAAIKVRVAAETRAMADALVALEKEEERFQRDAEDASDVTPQEAARVQFRNEMCSFVQQMSELLMMQDEAAELGAVVLPDKKIEPVGGQYDVRRGRLLRTMELELLDAVQKAAPTDVHRKQRQRARFAKRMRAACEVAIAKYCRATKDTGVDTLFSRKKLKAVPVCVACDRPLNDDDARHANDELASDVRAPPPQAYHDTKGPGTAPAGFTPDQFGSFGAPDGSGFLAGGSGDARSDLSRPGTVSFGSARPGGGVVYRGGFRLPRKGFGGAPSPGGSHGMSAEAAVASTPPRAPRPGTVGGTRPEVDQYQYQQAVDVKLPTLAHTPTQ